jgi:micrococcal nuclease
VPRAPRAHRLAHLAAGLTGLAGLAATAGVAARAAWPGPPPPGPGAAGAGRATVVRVIDGDTVVVALSGAAETVRLIGIDTPESVARDRPDECFGAEASRRLGDLLPPGTEVRLTRDVEPRDVYDRLLAYVHRRSDGLFANLAQVADGYAEARHYPPNTAHRAELERAERDARGAGLGLWSACGGTDVPLPVASPRWPRSRNGSATAPMPACSSSPATRWAPATPPTWASTRRCGSASPPAPR